jgi:hypothetical protein
MVTGAAAVPPRVTVAASAYVPARRKTVRPGTVDWSARAIVLHGRASVPGFRSLPLVAT